MADPRLTKLADLLVNYCVQVRPGQWTVINGGLVAAPLVREVHAAVLRAGGHPSVLLSDPETTQTMMREASDEQLQWVSPLNRLVVDEVDAIIALRGDENTRAMSGIDPARMARAQASTADLMKRHMERSAAGELKWVVTQYPTNASAQEAEMSLRDYEDFVYGATFVDRDDPIAEWRKVSERQQTKVDWLQGKSRLTVKSANCDLSLSIEGRTFINSDGTANMPSGEIFTSPVEDSVQGWVKFTFPAIYMGRSVEDAELEFKDGKVVTARASKNEDFLLSQLDIDDGSRTLGEFAIGTNFGIGEFTGNILFDEKIGGTVHMALGSGYPETGSQNESAIHWDMICDMRNGGEIHVDGELFYENGDFVA